MSVDRADDDSRHRQRVQTESSGCVAPAILALSVALLRSGCAETRARLDHCQPLPRQPEEPGLYPGGRPIQALQPTSAPRPINFVDGSKRRLLLENKRFDVVHFSVVERMQYQENGIILKARRRGH